MNILWIDLGIGDIGGGQIYNSRLMNSLDDNFNLFLLTSFEKFYVNNLKKNIVVVKYGRMKIYMDFLLNKIIKRRNRVLIILLLALPLFFELLYLKKGLKKLNINIDLIISTDGYYIGELLSIFSGFKKVKRIHLVHSATPINLKGVPFSRDFIKIILRFVSTYGRVFFLTLNSKATSDFNEIFPMSAFQLGVGIDVERYFPRNWEDRENIILYVGRIDERQKNLSILIKVARVVEGTQFKIVIAGDGKDLQYYKKLSSSLGVEPYINFLGYIGEDEKLELLARSKIFVNPSIEEGLSNAVLEAMSCGCATICVDNDGSRSAIVNNVDGIIISNYVVELESALRSLMNNERKMQFLSSNARSKVIQSFSLVYIANKLKKFLYTINQEA